MFGGLLRVVDESATVADFGVEHLAGAQCLVGLDEIDEVIWHTVVTSPRDVLHLVVDDDWCDVVLLLEDFTCLGGESCGGVGAGYGTTDVGGINEKSLISCFFMAKI